MFFFLPHSIWPLTVSGAQLESTKIREYVGTAAASGSAANAASNSGIGGAASNSFTGSSSGSSNSNQAQQRNNNNLDVIDEQSRGSQASSAAAVAAAAAGSPTGPFFDKMASKNVTALLGKTTYLNCRIKNLGNKTVSQSNVFTALKCASNVYCRPDC